MLEREFAKNEVIQVLNDLEHAKALGMDGFTDIFSKVLVWLKGMLRLSLLTFIGIGFLRSLSMPLSSF